MSNPYGWGDNEPQIKPKDQGGDTLATFSQKIYNLFDNLFVTLNSYPWSAATQNDAGYMSAADKTALDAVPETYLPKSTYKTGIWTPKLVGETVEGSLTYSTQTGIYVKVGRLVAVMGKLVVSNVLTQPTGYSLLKGLPYVISEAAVIPIRGQGGQSGCARKIIHASQNADGSNVLRLQGVNPSSISSTGQIENLRWSSNDLSSDYLMFASTAPMFEFNICGCYLTSS